MRKIKRVFTALAATVILASVGILALFHGGAGKEVFEQDEFFFDAAANNNYFLHALGPFRFLSLEDALGLRQTRSTLGWVYEYYSYQAWTGEGVRQMCWDERRLGINDPTLTVKKGTTYRDLLDVANEYRDVVQLIGESFYKYCWEIPANNLEVRFSAPSFLGENAGGLPIRFDAPRIVVKNISSEVQETVKIRWEVGVLGRQGAIAEGIVKEPVIGGLAEGEVYELRNIGWKTTHTRRLRDVVERLGNVEFTILACEQDHRPVDAYSFEVSRNQNIPDYQQISCLETNKNFSQLLLNLSSIRPRVKSMLADPRISD